MPPSSTSSRPFQRSLPASSTTSSAPSSEQRPRLRRGDRRCMPLRGVREDARVDERVVAEERGEVAPCRAAAANSGTIRTGMCSARSRSASCVEQRLVGVRVVEVADEQDRAVLHVRALQRLRAPSSRPEAMRVPPMNVSHGDCAEDRAAAVVAQRHEERDELQQRARRRVRRQQLVRGVGEHDEADRLVRVDDAAQRRRDARVDRPGDARRHVERDDAGARALRGTRPRGRRRPTRATTKSQRERRREREREDDAHDRRALRRRVRARAQVGERDRARCGGASGSTSRVARPASRAPARRTPRPLRPPACAATRRARARSASSSSARSTPSSPATRSNAFRCSVSSPCSCAQREHGERALERRARSELDGSDARPHDAVPAPASQSAPRTASAGERRARARRASDGRDAVRRRGDRRQAEPPVELVRPLQERCDAGADLREHLDRRPARVDPVRALAVRAAGSRCAPGGSGRRGTCRSAGRRGTHGDVRQRSVHVHVTCAKRPTRRRRIGGLFVGGTARSRCVTRSRAGSTHFVSATIAIFAVSESPNRWTVGAIVAYAFSGTPSPTDRAGRVEQPAGPARAAAGRSATSAARRRARRGSERASCDRSAPHLAQVGPAQERAEHLAEIVRVHGDRLDAERAEVARRGRPSAPRARRAGCAASFSVTYTGNDAAGPRVARTGR